VKLLHAKTQCLGQQAALQVTTGSRFLNIFGRPLCVSIATVETAHIASRSRIALGKDT